jgi:signal transduction histidine kinase
MHSAESPVIPQAAFDAIGNSDALFRILENLPVALGCAEPVQADGTVAQEARVTYYNKRWVGLFGFGTNEVKTVADATRRLYPDPEVRARYIARRKRAAAEARKSGHAVEALELVASGANGTPVHVLSSTTIVGDRMLVSMEDITARKEAELALARSLASEQRLRTEAENAVRAKSRFLASMSHEVRTPLTSLVSLARAMWIESSKHRLPEEFADLLNQVQSGGEYLNLILTNLLDISASEAGKSRVREEKFFVADWAADIRNILGPIAAAHGLGLDFRIPRDSEARFRSDPLRLSQILLNLGHNAVKFSGGIGGRVRIGVSVPGGRLRICVEDEGPGIEPRRLPELFGEFEQSEVRGPASDRGVGLGLAVVAQNTELLGGRVRARNLTPHGMRFVVSIPALPTRGKPKNPDA